jgi:hypothetical protein
MPGFPHSLLDRRSFLRGVGVSLALPALESLTPRAAVAETPTSAKAKRFVCISPTYGIYRGSLIPQAMGTLKKMPGPAKALEKHAADISLLSGLDHPDVGGGHGCSATFLNGMKMSMVRGDRRKMRSFDQFLVDRLEPDTRYPFISAGKGSPISYNGNGISIPSEADPQRLFGLLFAGDSDKAKGTRRNVINESKSILDNLAQDARALKGKLSRHDQSKFEEYLTAVRETEQKLQRRKKWIDVPKPEAPRDPFRAARREDSPPHDNEMHYEVMTLALQTDSTRFMTFQMPGGNGFLPIDGVTIAYHTLTHHGQNAEKISQLQLVDQWRLQQFSRFLDLLKSTEDADNRPLLDTTIVVFGSGMADASVHSHRNTPILVAGGGLKHGRHHRLPNGEKGTADTALCNLYVTLAQQFGIEVDKFSTSNGDLNHLLG